MINQGDIAVTVDGKLNPTSSINLIDDKQVHQVEILMSTKLIEPTLEVKK